MTRSAAGRRSLAKWYPVARAAGTKSPLTTAATPAPAAHVKWGVPENVCPGDCGSDTVLPVTLAHSVDAIIGEFAAALVSGRYLEVRVSWSARSTL